MAGLLSAKGGVGLIMGAATGIGRSTVQAYARQGVKNLFLADINAKALAATAKDVLAEFPSISIETKQFDVTSESAIMDTIKSAVSAFRRIDYAVNNVGISGPIKPSTQVETSEFLNCITVNMTGLWISQREQLKQMMKQEPLENSGPFANRGVIVNTASMYGLVAGDDCTAYNASKHAVIGITKGDAGTFSKHNIRINCLCPGFIETPMMGSEQDLQSFRDSHQNRVPMKRFGQPEEMANSIVFLSSSLSSYMVGAALVADGGWSIV